MRKKNLRTKIMMGGIAAAILIIIALVIILVIGKKRFDEAKSQVSALKTELTDNTRLVYVAAREIKKGEQVTGDNVAQQMIYTGLSSDYYMSSEDLGQTAIVDIKVNEPVMKTMVAKIELTKDMRKYEIASAHLMTTQKEYDTVDVRILFPNGEDYLLLAKKPVMDLQMGTSIFTTYLNEDEILRMASAMVDAYTTTGAKIYTTKYVEENIQEKPVPNYLVKAAVLDLINSDPNIVEQAETTLNLRARNDLDSRLGALSEEQLSAVAAGMNLEDTAKASVIREGIAIETQSGNEIPEQKSEPVQTETSGEEPENDAPADSVFDFDNGTTVTPQDTAPVPPEDDGTLTLELTQ